MNKVRSWTTRQRISQAHIKRTFIVLISLLVFGFYIFLCRLTLRVVEKNTENQYETDCGSVAIAYADGLTRLLRQYQSDLRVFSDSDIVKNGDTRQITAWVQSHDNLRPSYFLNLMFSDLDGNAYMTNGLSVNISDRQYFQEIAEGGQDTSIDNGVTSKTTGKLIFHVARAAYSEKGKRIGIFAASIELATIQKLITPIHIGAGGYAFVINDEGRFISYPDSRYLMKWNSEFVKDTDDSSLDYMWRYKNGHFQTKSVNGKPILVAFASVDECDWTIGISVPEAQIHESSNVIKHLQVLIIAMMLIGSVIFIGIEILIIHRIQRKAELESDYDRLTGLWTRQKFEKEAQRLLRYNRNMLFILIEADIRGFKVLNQTYGTKRTDEMLVELADMLRTFADQYDGYIGRGYADRFYALFPAHNEGTAISAFRICLNSMNKQTKETEFPFFTKFGIAFCEPHQPKISIRDLIGKAAYAKTTINGNFITQYAVFSEDMQDRIDEEQKIESCMEKALRDNEFYVVYQPKISLKTERIVGAEALVRWSNKEYGLLPPSRFVPLFEKNGFIVKLDFFVYEHVFRFLQQERDAGRPVVPISVNMSRSHANPEQFIKEFKTLFQKYNIPPSLIEVEIIERTSETGKFFQLELTNLLHQNGFSVAMDDFGSGESSLNMLSSIPVDVLKFDQNFLKTTTDDERSAGFITKLVEMGKELNKSTVFEGVETKRQIEFLKSIDCDQVQGYYYSKPLSEEEFIKYLSEHV